MPLTGFMCCRDDEMHTFADCISCARNHTCMYPLPLLKEMANHQGERIGVGLSASELGGCPRQYVLKQEVDYAEYPEDYCARFNGTNFHSGLVMEGETQLIQEERFNGSVGGIPISGKPDLYDMVSGTIIDWKTTKKVPLRPYESHVLQVNVYAELLEQNGLIVNDAIIWYFDGHFRRRAVPLMEREERAEGIHAIAATFIHDGHLPERIPGYPDHFLCTSCPVRDACVTREG